MSDPQRKFRQEYTEATGVGLELQLLVQNLREWSDAKFGPTTVRNEDLAIEKIQKSMANIELEGATDYDLARIFLWTIEAAERCGLPTLSLIDEAGYALDAAKTDISLDAEKQNIEYLEPYLISGGSDDEWVAEAYVGDQKLQARGESSDDARHALDAAIKAYIATKDKEEV